MTTAREDHLPCAGCLEWYPASALRLHSRHPYCAHCYPGIRVVRADTGGERAVAADMMKRRPE